MTLYTRPAPLPAFGGYGIELQYMIVDCETLDVRPLAPQLLAQVKPVVGPDGTPLGWSNEWVAHVVELQNDRPTATLELLAAGFEAEIARATDALASEGARLMPTGMHPWMDPVHETVPWPHDEGGIYATCAAIFNCRSHGWANVQAMLLNLPFSGEDEFARLHAAIRLVLPILPALAASSPLADGKRAHALDQRLIACRSNASALPSITGLVVPEPVRTRAEYQTEILQPMYAEIAAHDPNGVLRHEWLNARGAIARFDRSAIEIRVIDVQECPLADLAIAAATVSVVRAVYEREAGIPQSRNTLDTATLAGVLDACTRDGERAAIGNASYLSMLGYPGRPCTAGELWTHLIGDCSPDAPVHVPAFRDALDVILEEGPLARRILRALSGTVAPIRMREVYGELCDCLESGALFSRGS
ncbi:MAG: glutamate-cysteine ligase family protein [Betaproteobacteria bacterium]